MYDIETLVAGHGGIDTYRANSQQAIITLPDNPSGGYSSCVVVIVVAVVH